MLAKCIDGEYKKNDLLIAQYFDCFISVRIIY